MYDVCVCVCACEIIEVVTLKVCVVYDYFLSVGIRVDEFDDQKIA